ncbi:hypothetical protein D3C77_15610 [compost metagenome]
MPLAFLLSSSQSEPGFSLAVNSPRMGMGEVALFSRKAVAFDFGFKQPERSEKKG